MSVVKRVPDEVEDITPEWFSVIIGKQVQESTFKLTPNIHSGTGFLSTMFRVCFNTEDGKSYKVIVKLLPREDDKLIGETRELVVKDNYDRTEILTYKILIPELIKEVPEIQKYFCEIYFAEIREASKDAPYSSVLVLQDLKPEGYFMVDFAKNMKLKDFSQGLDFLAKLHAGSICLENRKKTTLTELYPWLPKWHTPGAVIQAEPTLFTFFTDGFPILYKMLALNPNVQKSTYEILQILEKNAKNIFHKILEAGHKHACLVHGDVWSHNIMLREDNMKAIDWQLVGYSDPAFDLGIYIPVCIPTEYLNVELVAKAADEYYQNICKLAKELGFEIKRTSEEFFAFFETYGLAFGFVWIVMACSTLISNEKYLPKFQKIFQLFVEMKVLDFILSIIQVK